MFRTSDAEKIADYRVSAELSAIESTTDGKSLILGTLDGCLSTLAIADPKKGSGMRDYLKSLPSRDETLSKKLSKPCLPIHWKMAAKMAALASRVILLTFLSLNLER